MAVGGGASDLVGEGARASSLIDDGGGAAAMVWIGQLCGRGVGARADLDGEE